MGEKNGSLLIIAMVVLVGLALSPLLKDGFEGFANSVIGVMQNLIPSVTP